MGWVKGGALLERELKSDCSSWHGEGVSWRLVFLLILLVNWVGLVRRLLRRMDSQFY